jgi:hypothetical protein
MHFKPKRCTNEQPINTKSHHVSNLGKFVTLLSIYIIAPCKVYTEIDSFLGNPNGSPKTIKLWILQLWGFITFPFLFQIEKFQKKIYGLSKEFFKNIIFFQSKVIWSLKLSFTWLGIILAIWFLTIQIMVIAYAIDPYFGNTILVYCIIH